PQPLLDGFLGHRHDIILPCAVAWAADGADQGPDQGSGLESFGTNYRSGHQSVGQIKALDTRVSDLSNRVGGTEQKLEDFRKDVSGRFNTPDQLCAVVDLKSAEAFPGELDLVHDLVYKLRR